MLFFCSSKAEKIKKRIADIPLVEKIKFDGMSDATYQRLYENYSKLRLQIQHCAGKEIFQTHLEEMATHLQMLNKIMTSYQSCLQGEKINLSSELEQLSKLSQYDTAMPQWKKNCMIFLGTLTAVLIGAVIGAAIGSATGFAAPFVLALPFYIHFISFNTFLNTFIPFCIGAAKFGAGWAGLLCAVVSGSVGHNNAVDYINQKENEFASLNQSQAYFYTEIQSAYSQLN